MSAMNSAGARAAGEISAEFTLSRRQVLVMIGIGLAFWYAGAASVRLLGSMALFGPTNSMFAYILALPVSWTGVLLSIRLAGLRAAQILPAIVVGTCAATFCDGIGLTWAQWLYGSDPAQVSLGAAWILWGIWPFFAAGYVEALRRAER